MDKKGKPMKIYIAGKITGEPRYLEKFKAEETRFAEARLHCAKSGVIAGENDQRGLYADLFQHD